MSATTAPRLSWRGYLAHSLKKEYDAYGTFSSQLFNFPNAVTLLRLALIAPLSWAIFNDSFFWICGTVLVFALLDNLDGYLARQWGQSTRFGVYFDKFVDATAVFVGAYLLTKTHRLPNWLWLLLPVKYLVQTVVAFLLLHQRQVYPPVYFLKNRLGFGFVTACAILAAAFAPNGPLRLMSSLLAAGFIVVSTLLTAAVGLRRLRATEVSHET